MSRGGVLGLLFFSFFHVVDYGVVGVLGYIFHSVSFLTKNPNRYFSKVTERWIANC